MLLRNEERQHGYSYNGPAIQPTDEQLCEAWMINFCLKPCWRG